MHIIRKNLAKVVNTYVTEPRCLGERHMTQKSANTKKIPNGDQRAYHSHSTGLSQNAMENLQRHILRS